MILLGIEERYRSVNGGQVGGTLGPHTPWAHRLEAADRLSEPCTPFQVSRDWLEVSENWKILHNSPGARSCRLLAFSLLPRATSALKEQFLVFNLDAYRKIQGQRMTTALSPSALAQFEKMGGIATTWGGGFPETTQTPCGSLLPGDTPIIFFGAKP